MRISWYILHDPGDFIILRILNGDELPQRIVFSEIFLGYLFGHDKRIRLHKCGFWIAKKKRECEDIEKLSIHTKKILR